MAGQQKFVVDTSGVSLGSEVDVCRFALRLVAEDAKTFEADIPLSRATDWPTSVRKAAERLSRHATGSRDEGEYYKKTGVVSASDHEDWEAFVCFAPYAFDATVWGADRRLVDLADEGTSLVVHLSSVEREQLESFDDALSVVPVTRWRKRKPRRRQGSGPEAR
jgi:hypothetical protein